MWVTSGYRVILKCHTANCDQKMLHVQEDHLLGSSSLSCYIMYIATSTPFFDPVIGHNVIKSE